MTTMIPRISTIRVSVYSTLKASIVIGVVLLWSVRSAYSSTTDMGTSVSEIDFTTDAQSSVSVMTSMSSPTEVVTEYISTEDNHETTETQTTEEPARITCYECSDTDCGDAPGNGANTCETTGACWMSYNRTTEGVERYCATEEERTCDVDDVMEQEDTCSVCCDSDECNDIAVTSCEDLADFLEEDNKAHCVNLLTSLVVLPTVLSFTISMVF